MSRRTAARSRPRRRSWPRLSGRTQAIALALLVLGLLGVARWGSSNPPPPPPAYVVPTLGDENAPVTIGLYTDFGCSACGDFVRNGFQRDLIEAYVKTGKAKLVFHHLIFTGPDAQLASEAAACASTQGRFWEYADAVFIERPAFTKDGLERLAAGLGLDSAAFNSCFEGRTFRAAVVHEALQVKQMAIKNAPLITVNARRIEGAQPLAALAPLIEAELAGRGR